MKALFIINPIAGSRKKNTLPELIKDLIRTEIRFEIRLTRYRGEASEITREWMDQFPESYVIAAGGDGTVNEIGSCLVDSPGTLGVLPTGSGNGLARSLGLPMNIRRAIDAINEGATRMIDAGVINEKFFFCTAGIGFDALIGKAFATRKLKGLTGYAGHVIREFFQYNPENYTLSYAEQKMTRNAFLITIANASQYGNNVYISPGSQMDDGLLDLCILDKFPRMEALKLAIQLFNKTIHRSKHYTRIPVSSASIQLPEDSCYHLDGDFYEAGEHLNISVKPRSLRVIAG